MVYVTCQVKQKNSWETIYEQETQGVQPKHETHNQHFVYQNQRKNKFKTSTTCSTTHIQDSIPKLLTSILVSQDVVDFF